MLLLFFACASPEAPQAPELTLRLDDVQAAVVWIGLAEPTEADVSCAYSWSFDGGTLGTVSGTGSAGPEAPLFGVPVDVELTVTATCSRGELSSVVEDAIFTGRLPQEVKGLSLLSGDPAEFGERWFLYTETHASSAVVISNTAGEAVWWTAHPGAILTHPRYDAEAQAVVVIAGDPMGDGDNLMLMPLVGDAVKIPVPGAHHDFVRWSANEYLLAYTQVQDVDGELIAGDHLAIVDVTTGTITDVWNAFDELPIVENKGWELRYGDAADWTHINGLFHDVENNQLLVSFYYDEAIMALDTTTWDPVWTIGGPNATITLADPFGPQHSPTLVDGDLFLFDNGSVASEGSRVAAWDLSTDPAPLVYEWQPDPVTFDVVLGTVSFGADNMLVALGDGRRIYVVQDDMTTLSYESKATTPVGMTTWLPDDWR